MSQVKLTPVKSSQLKSVGYDINKSTLIVRFLNGKTYKYEFFSKQEYEDFINSESVGKHFHANIKTNKLINSTEIK